MATEHRLTGDQRKAAPDHAGFWISRIDRMIKKELTERLAPLGLSLPEYTVLSLLDREPGMSGAEMARRTLVSPQAINEMISSLERRTMIERNVDPGHGRILQMRLTSSGSQTLAAACEQVESFESELLAGLDPDERRQLFGLLLTCAGNLGAGVQPVS
jgi:DNA-binding MarR family transcriptional regulator